jgi:hypothetical protein
MEDGSPVNMYTETYQKQFHPGEAVKLFSYWRIVKGKAGPSMEKGSTQTQTMAINGCYSKFLVISRTQRSTVFFLELPLTHLEALWESCGNRAVKSLTGCWDWSPSPKRPSSTDRVSRSDWPEMVCVSDLGPLNSRRWWSSKRRALCLHIELHIYIYMYDKYMIMNEWTY